MKNTHILGCALTMPPRSHEDKTKPFNPMESQVYQWLIQQEEVQMLLLSLAKGAIVYDKITDTWRGKNYIDGKNNNRILPFIK